MNVVKTIEHVRRSVGQAVTEGKAVGLVPTMGALHEGHFSLIETARTQTDFVVVSIFVNPTQFRANEDLSNYPNTPEADLAACEQRGVDLVFSPHAEAMYPSGSLTEVTVRQLSETLCGRQRPGHFDGVCTVVAKLLNIVRPEKAYFGAKDFQQSVLVRRMVRDLNLPVEIVVCPIIREADGLAMSSRNAYLTPRQRRQAAELSRSLRLGQEMIRKRHPASEEVIAAIGEYLSGNAPDGEVDYIQIVDPERLTDVERTDAPVVIALAVRFGAARLIDNMLVDSRGGGS